MASSIDPNATNPDSKVPVFDLANQTRGESMNLEDARSAKATALAAEKQWELELGRPPNAYQGQTVWTNGRSNRIRLVSTKAVPPADGSSVGYEQVEFSLSPEISESKQVIYAEIGDIRQAASILIYGGSPSRKWSVNAKFLSRTQEEAEKTWKSIQLMRSWTNPDTNYKYGIDSSTPHVLKFYGYGRTWQGIPVVLASLNVDYPSDVDYIPTSYGTNVPVIQSVTFNLTEARIPDDLLNGKFDLEKFKLGVLPEW